MIRWLVILGIGALLTVAIWAYAKITKNGPDRSWSDRQDDGNRQIQRSETGI